MLPPSPPACVAAGPIAATITATGAEAISAEATRGDAASPAYRIGPFRFRGHAIDIASRDPRFAALVLGADGILRDSCRAAYDAPGGWNAAEAPRAVTLTPQRGTGAPAAPGSIAAAEAKIRPLLAGATLGPSWPVYRRGGQFFLGIAYPHDGTGSLIVAFKSAPGSTPPARVVARLTMRAGAITLVPALHTPDQSLNLAERRADGTIRQVVLHLADADAGAIAEMLSD